MKLKADFITQDIDGTQFLVPVGAENFNGIVKSNETAAFIVDCLKEEISFDGIVDKMSESYDAPRDVIASDVTDILSVLRKINAIEE